MEIVSLVAFIVSMIIGGFAIWLSITFYKMSTAALKETAEAAKEISSGVRRLDDLFNKLYSDTFGIMKDTMTDMRKHIWPDVFMSTSQPPAKEIEFFKDILVRVPEEMKAKLKKLLDEQEISEPKSEALEKGLSENLKKTIQDSQNRLEQILTERFKEIVLSIVGHRGIQAKALYRLLIGKQNFSPQEFFREMYQLKKAGFIMWEGKKLEPESLIKKADGGTRQSLN